MGFFLSLKWHYGDHIVGAWGVGANGVVGAAVDDINAERVDVTGNRSQKIGGCGGQVVELVIDGCMSLRGPLLAALDLLVLVRRCAPLGVADAEAYRSPGSIDGDVVQQNKWFAAFNLRS